MTIAYFDCFSGAGGDMIVGALLDAGVDFQAFQTELAKLKLDGFSIRSETVLRGGMAGRKFHVDVAPGESPTRCLPDILEIIDSAGLAPRPAERARKIFTRLAKAEAHVHGIDVDKVHFHEVGAVDSIVDIVGATVAMEMLTIERVYCSPIPLGSGTVTCQHGQIPVPAPATARLLLGAKTYPGSGEGELTTPTAAAVLTTLAERFGPPPEMELLAVGYGAGTRQTDSLPNLLRVYIGRESDAGSVDSVVELAANIDDCTGEVIGSTIEKLLAGGCLDAWAAPVFTKKSRPAWTLFALCRPCDVEEAERMLFVETTTFGVRRRVCNRSKLQRTFETVETPYGSVRVKIGRLEGRVVTSCPEFNDCLSAADAHHVPVREVIDSARSGYCRTGES